MYCVTLTDSEVLMLRKALDISLCVTNCVKADFQLYRLTELNTTIEEQLKAQYLAKQKLKP